MQERTDIAQKARDLIDQAADLLSRRRNESALAVLNDVSSEWPIETEPIAPRFFRLLAECYYRLGQSSTALRTLRLAESHAVRLNQPLEQAECSLLLADLLRDRNEFRQAQKACRDAESLFRRNEDRAGECRSLNKLAGLYARQSDYPLALEALLEAVEIARSLQDRAKLAFMLGNLGRIYGFTGQLDEAEAHLRSNIELSTELGDTLEAARAQVSLADLKGFAGDLREGLQLAQTAQATFVGLRASRDELIALITIGILHNRAGKYAEAIQLLQTVVLRAPQFAPADSGLVARAQRHLALAALSSGKTELATRMLNDATRSFAAIGNKAELGALAALRARLAQKAGDAAAARTYFSEGMDLLHQSSNQLELIDLLEQVGQSKLFGERESMLYLFRVEEFMARNRLTTRLEQIGELIARPAAATSAAQLSLVIDHQPDASDYPTTIPAIRAFMQQLRSIGSRDLPVLLTGETGVGKDRMARYYHAQVRPDGPFVAINCASIPETLLESELFGYRKGAFSGADQSRDGLLLAAHRGVLFLDEIGDMPLGLQAKLLGVLERRRFIPLGSTTEVELDIRLVAATNQPLQQLVREGRFRSDLYYRLDGISFHLPPLRERRDDLPLLIALFMQRHGLLAAGASPSASLVNQLAAYDWPGNIRQLENKIKQMALTSSMVVEGDLQELGRSLLEPLQRDHERSVQVASVDAALPAGELHSFDRSLFERVEELERKLLTEALSATHGNKSEAARLLGVHEATVRMKIKRYGLLAGGATIH